MTELDKYGGDTSRKFESTGFFRVERAPDRWWFADPEGHAWLTIGIAHAEDSDLKYPHNVDIWRNKYGGSKERWAKEGVAKDFRSWGFNTIGWTQDYIGGGWRKAFDWAERITVQQSNPQFSRREFDAADMPYVVLLRGLETEDWNGDPLFPDVWSLDFDDHVNYLARSFAVDHADSENLVGYSYVDAPSWAPHVSGADFPQLKGLTGDARDHKLFDVASRYYEAMATAIRQFDTNHLILGDLFNGNRPLPDPVLEALKPYVDVLAIQYFPGNTEAARAELREHAARSSKLVDKPLYIPDIGNWAPTKLNPHRVADPTGRLAGVESQAARAQMYIDELESVINEPWWLGMHWCAYIENKARGWGIKDPWDQPYEDFVRPVTDYNESIYDRITATRAGTLTGSGR
jgi:hypothetical protein